MYLHLGGDISVSVKNIVAIMDLETTSVSKITKEFLRIAQQTDCIVSINDDLPKSYVITSEGEKTTVFISPISSQTLLKRANNIGAYFSTEQFK